MNDEPKCIVIDRHGNAWGPFESAQAAAAWAKKKWPDQDQDECRINGWDVAALHAPDTFGG